MKLMKNEEKHTQNKKKGTLSHQNAGKSMLLFFTPRHRSTKIR